MKKEKTRKCKYCKEIATISQMHCEQNNGKNTFFHHECFKKHTEEMAFKKKEQIELDLLVEKIKEIYDVKILPNQVFPYIQDLRNGTRFFGKTKYFYKNGYSYKIIEETYEYCSETIIYWLKTKDFDSFLGAFKYGLAIVSDKINIVEQIHINRIENQRNAENSTVNDDFETNYKKNKKNINEYDFIDFD